MLRKIVGRRIGRNFWKITEIISRKGNKISKRGFLRKKRRLEIVNKNKSKKRKNTKIQKNN